MGGKSIYMCQIVLIVLLVYIGSYVLVQKVEIGFIDCIFICVGVVDDLVSGCLIFMVEMIEIVNILYNVIEYSLVLMDEIGCGMFIYDGLLLVWVCVENLVNKIKVLILFVIYYFEFIQLLEKMEGVVNVYFDVLEYGDIIVFMYSVQDGVVSKSYGLVVVVLVGVLKEVIKCVWQKLCELESILFNVVVIQVDGMQMLLFVVLEEILFVVEVLENFDLDFLILCQVLEWIYCLKSLVQFFIKVKNGSVVKCCCFSK